MSDLIPWLFIIPPALVAIAAITAALVQRTPGGRAHALMVRGGQHLHRKELEQAEALFRQGLALKPDHGPLLGTLGSLLAGQERWEEALPLLQRAHDAQPRDMPIRLVLGRCHQATGQIDKALAHWTAIAPDDPVYIDAQGLLAEHFEASGDLDAATQALQRAIDKAEVHAARPLKKELKRLQDLQKGKPGEAAAAEGGTAAPESGEARKRRRATGKPAEAAAPEAEQAGVGGEEQAEPS